MVSRPFRGDCNESRLSVVPGRPLAGARERQLVDHLDHCEDCRRTLERLAAGSRLWAELREMAPEFGPVPAAGPPLTETFGARPRSGEGRRVHPSRLPLAPGQLRNLSAAWRSTT